MRIALLSWTQNYSTLRAHRRESNPRMIAQPSLTLCWRTPSGLSLVQCLMLCLALALFTPSTVLAKDKLPGRQLSDLNKLEDKAHAKAQKAQKAADRLGKQMDSLDHEQITPKQWERLQDKHSDLVDKANEATRDYEDARDAGKAARDQWAKDTAAKRAEYDEALKNPDLDPCNRALAESFIKAHKAREAANKLRDKLDGLDQAADEAVDKAEEMFKKYESMEGDRRSLEGSLKLQVSAAKSAIKKAKEARRQAQKLDRQANSLESSADRAARKAARSKACNPPGDAESDTKVAVGTDANPVSTTVNPEHRAIIYLGENINPEDFIKEHGLTGAHIMSTPKGLPNGLGSMISVADSPALRDACAANGGQCEADHCQEFLLPDGVSAGEGDFDDIPDDIDVEYSEEDLAEIERFNREMEEINSNKNNPFDLDEDDDASDDDSDDTPSITPGKWLVMAGTGWASTGTPLDPGTTGGEPGTTGGDPGTSGGQPGGTPGSTPGSSGGEPGTTGGDPGTSGGDPGTTGGEPGTSGGQPGTTASGGDAPPGTPISIDPDDLDDGTIDDIADSLDGESDDASTGGEDQDGGVEISEEEQELLDNLESQPPGTVARYEAAAELYRYRIAQAQAAPEPLDGYIREYQNLLEDTLTQIMTMLPFDTPGFYLVGKELAELLIEQTNAQLEDMTPDDPAYEDTVGHLELANQILIDAEAGLAHLEEGKDPDLPVIPIGGTVTRDDDEEDEDEVEDDDTKIVTQPTSIKGNVKTGAGEALANAVIVLFPQGPSVADAVDNDPGNDPEWDDGPLVKTQTDEDGNYNVDVEPSPTTGGTDQAATSGNTGGTTTTADKTMASTGGTTRPTTTPTRPSTTTSTGDKTDPFATTTVPTSASTSAADPAQNQGIEKYYRGRISEELNDPKTYQLVDNAYGQKKNASESAAVTYARALTDTIPDWFTRYPNLLSSLLSNSESRRFLLGNYASKIPESVIRSHPGVMVEYIRSVSEKKEPHLWTLVDVHWTNNWTQDTPGAVTVLEGLNRWTGNNWITEYPELVNVFLANPHTKELIIQRLEQMQAEELATFRSAIETYVKNNAHAIEDTEGVQEEQVWGALLVQQRHILNLIEFRGMLTRYRSMTVAQKSSFIRSMTGKAEELFNARASMVEWRRTATTIVKSNLHGKWRETDHGRKQREYEKLMKAGRRDEAAKTHWGKYLAARDRYVKLLNDNPILALKSDSVLRDEFLFNWIWNGMMSNASQESVAAVFDKFLRVNIDNLSEEIETVAKIDEWDDLQEFGTPRYARAQQQVINRMNGAHFLPGSGWVNVLIGDQDVKEAERIYYQMVKDGVLSLIAITPIVFPVLAPVALAADIILVVDAGDELVVTLLDEENAEDFAGVTGHRYHMTAADKLSAAQGKLALTSLSFLPLAYSGIKNIKVVDKTRPRNPVVAGGGRAATSGDDAARVMAKSADAAPSTGGYRIAGATDDLNELAANAAKEGVPTAEIDAIIKRYVDDVGKELDPAVHAQIHNELVIASANAKDLTIVVQKGIGGRLPGERYLFDIEELADMAGGTRPRNPVKETDLVLWQQINAKSATRPRKPGPNATADELKAYEAELANWEAGWTQEMVSYVENGVLTRSDADLLRMWEFNPYESVGSKFFSPERTAGLAKIFTPDDLARLRSIWREKPPRPVATTPRSPGPGPGQGPSVAPPRPGMDLESTVAGRGDAPPKVSFNPEPPAPVALGGKPADPGSRSLLSASEYDELLARQNGGEILDLTEVPRPGIANVSGGRVGIGQGAGRYEKLRAGESADLFIPEGQALPPGVTVLERGVSGQTVYNINMLSSRGAAGSNPVLLKALTDGKTFVRVKVPRELAVAPTSKIGHTVGELTEELRAWAKQRGPNDPVAQKVNEFLDSPRLKDKSLVEQQQTLNELKDVLGDATPPGAAPSTASTAPPSPPSPPAGGAATATPAPKQPTSINDLVKQAMARSEARNLRDSVQGGESYVPVSKVPHYHGAKNLDDVVEIGHVVDDHYVRNSGPGKMYETSTVPPTHTTNRAGLMGIRRDPLGLTRDTAGNAAWSYEGTLRGGDVVLRLNEQGRKFVKMRAVNEADRGFGQVPEYYPQGLDASRNGIGPSQPNVPAKFLEYYNYQIDKWMPVAP